MLYTLTPGSCTRVSNTGPWKLNEVFPVATQTAITVTTNWFLPKTIIYPYSADGTRIVHEGSGEEVYYLLWNWRGLGFKWVSSLLAFTATLDVSGEYFTSEGTSAFAFYASGVGSINQPLTDFDICQPLDAGTQTFYFPLQEQTITFAIPTVILSGEDDFGQPFTQEVEIYDSFQYRGGEGLPPYESEQVTLAASSSSGLTSFVYTSSDPTVAGISDTNKLKMLKREAVTITASQTGDADWSPASASVTITPSSLKLGQTITVVVPERMNVGDFANFSYSASSGLPVQVIIHSPDVVKLSADGRLNALRPGGCAITFSQEGNDEYESEDKVIVILVDGLPQTLTFTTIPADLKVGDVVTLTAISSAGLAVIFDSSDKAIMSVSGNVLNIFRQGYAKISVKTEDSLIYTPAAMIQEVAVGRGDQILVFPDFPSVPYGAERFPIGAFATSGLPVTAVSSNPSVAVIFNREIQILGVGNTTITVSQTGNAFWSAAPVLQQLLSVVKSPQSIVFFGLPSRINISERVLLKAVSTSGGAVTFFVSGALKLIEENGIFFIQGISEGQGTITANGVGGVNFEIASVSFNVIVGRRPQEIIFPLIEPRTFNFRSFSIVASATSDLPVSFVSSAPDVASVTSLGAVTVHKAGMTVITAAQAGNGEFFPATSLQNFLVIDKGEQQISFLPPAPVFATQVSIPLFASAPGGAVVFTSSNPEVVQMNGNIALIKGLGAARIVVTQAGSNDFVPAVVVMPIFVVPLRNSEATPLNNIFDSEPHTLAISAPTGAVAILLTAPVTLDSEVHNSLFPAEWSPASIPTVFWYDAADAATITATGTRITRVTDKSGNGYTLNVDAGQFSPFTNTRTLNNKNVFEWTNNNCLEAVFTHDQATTPLNIATVCLVSGADPQEFIWSGTTSATAGQRLSFRDAGAWNLVGGVGGSNLVLRGGAAVREQAHIVLTKLNAANSQIRLNGTLTGSGQIGTNAMTVLQLGHNETEANDLRGFIAEMVAFSADINQEIVEGYLAWKWGLQGNLPAGHPYKNLRPGGAREVATVPINTILDQSAFSSVGASATFTGGSKTLDVNGADHENYLAGRSSVFSGASAIMPPATEQDFSSNYGSTVPSAPKTASDCVKVKYDGRDLFELYAASLPKVLDGYLLIVGDSYLLLDQTNEDGVSLSGKIIL